MFGKRLCPSCLVVLLICLTVTVLPVEPAGAISGVTFGGYDLPDPDRMPYSVTAGPDGNMWFTENSGNNIGRITPAGIIDEFEVPTPACIPLDIAPDTAGNLWFTEYNGNRIGRITTEGDIEEFTVPTASSQPAGITAGAAGSMWFTEHITNKIGLITRDGNITECTLPHTNSRPFEIVTGPDGCRWFTEYNGDRIGRITPTGGITEFDLAAGSGPWGITAGPDQALWFTEYNGNRIGRITPAGGITEWDLPDAGSSPIDITAGPDGALWFTEHGSDRIGRITTGGELDEWDIPDAGSSPMGITQGPDSALWFAENNNNRLGRLEVDGKPWYLAEGCTAGGMETWVLVQNPNPSAVTVDLTLMTDSGIQEPPSLQGVSIPAGSRMTFNIGEFVTTFNVSTRVTPTGGDVICERAVYGDGRTWGTDSIGATSLSPLWYLAEGCTGGDFETWILVQNPNNFEITVDLNFMTSEGLEEGPQDFPIPAGSRHSFNAGEYVTDYDVSTKVESTGGFVVCERAMYGNDRQWAHDSVGVTNAASTWYMAEGCTAGGFETWVLIQNPHAWTETVDVTLMTVEGSLAPPELQGLAIPGNSRESINLGEYVESYDVSTKVVAATDDYVICERAVYGAGRIWGTDSIGSTRVAPVWYLAEGCTDGGMETWVLVQNPNDTAVTVDLTFMTSDGILDGPRDVEIPARSRESFDVGEYVTDYNVSTRVEVSACGIICERAMYGNARQWAHDSIGYAP